MLKCTAMGGKQDPPPKFREYDKLTQTDLTSILTLRSTHLTVQTVTYCQLMLPRASNLLSQQILWRNDKDNLVLNYVTRMEKWRCSSSNSEPRQNMPKTPRVKLHTVTKKAIIITAGTRTPDIRLQPSSSRRQKTKTICNSLSKVSCPTSTVLPPYSRVMRSKNYRGYMKPQIIPNAIYNVIFV
jgi:hypothetical protein